MNDRKLRNRKQRAQLYLDFNGKCAECGTDLVKWHADHKIPFVLTKQTVYSGMQPLCPPCNLRKGKKVIVPKNRHYYEALNLGTYVDVAAFRTGQRGAFNCIVEKVLEKSKTITCVLPTRYGKSDVIRASAIELVERGIADGAIIAAPCKLLRDQLCARKKVDEMVSRYSISTSKPISHAKLETFNLPIFPNKEYFVALCTQMLAANIKQICDYIRMRIQKTGKTVLVYVDESHTASDVNVWGGAVSDVTNAGGIVILVTATPYREGGQKIPGFRYIIEDEQERERHVPRQHENLDKIWIDTFKDLQGKVRLEADYEYSFKDAWAEENVICKIDKIPFDVVVEIPAGDPNDPNKTKEVAISEMSPTECRKYLGRVVRDDKVIERGVTDLLEKLSDYRSHEPKAQAIVFCGNDIENEDDGHAKRIKAEIKCQNSSYKVVIATSNQDSADKLIKDFSNSKGDILIVKQMASLGLDNPPIKIGLDLSAVRTLSAFIQRMMRAATIWGTNQVAYWITPSDGIGQALWENFVEENGGSITTHESTKISSVEKDKTEKEDNNELFKVLRTEDLKLSDSSNNGSFNVSDYDEYARPLIKAHPKFQSIFTHGELVDFGRTIGKEALSKFKTKPVAATRDITEERTLLKNRINWLARKIAGLKCSPHESRPQWVEVVKDCHRRAKQHAGIDPRKPLDRITNVEALTKMRDFLKKEKNSTKRVTN